MKNPILCLGSTAGFTVAELVVTVAVLSILITIASASYEVVQARVRCSQVKGDMDAFAQAGYTDFSYNGDWYDFMWDGNPMPNYFVQEGLLSHWPSPPCPGMTYNWENWSSFDINAVRVTLRRADSSALWSYCVDVLGGGNCQTDGGGNDPPFGGSPIEISTATVVYLYCNE